MAIKVYDKHSNTAAPSTDTRRGLAPLDNPWRIVGINWTAVAMFVAAIAGMIVMAATGGPF